MLNLPNPNWTLEVVTGSAVAIGVHASFVDLSTTQVVSPDAKNTPISLATTTTVVAPPPASTDRNVKFLSINNEGLSACVITVRLNDGVSVINCFGPIPLPPAWTIQYNSDGDGFVVYDDQGNIQVASKVAAVAAIGAGTQTGSTGTIVFSNSNNVSFGMSNSSVVTAIAEINVSAGTTSQNLSAITFGSSPGVSFGMAGSVVTASAFVGTVTAFSQDAEFVTNFTASHGILSLQKVSLPMNLLATQVVILADFVGSTGSSGAVTISHAVYTLSGAIASLASSGSRAFSWQSGSATNASSQYGGASGTRYRTMSVSYAMTPGDYLFGWWVSTDNAVTVKPFGRAAMNIVGTFDGIDTNYFLNGYSTSTVAAFPGPISVTDTGYVRTGFSAMRQVGAILLGTH